MGYKFFNDAWVAEGGLLLEPFAEIGCGAGACEWLGVDHDN
jgi:hypothetical protein